MTHAVELKRAIVNELDDYVAANDVPPAPEDVCAVTYGWTEQARTHRCRIFTGTTTVQTPPHGMRSGANHRSETGTFDLVVQVQAPGEDTYGADTRVTQLGGLVEAYISTLKQGDLSGIPGVNWVIVTEVTYGAFMDDASTVAQAVYNVQWNGRLEN